MGLRSGNPDAEPELRDFLSAYFCDLRQMYVNAAQRSRDEQFELYTRSEWSPLIDALLDGRAVSFRRFELPKDHQLAPPHGGDPGDLLELR